MMRRVLYALAPILLFSLYLYGLRALLILAFVFAAGIVTELLFMKTRGKKVSEAVLVTCALYGLSMPPGVPVWIAVVGIVFAVLFGKCVYGGFGRNIFNPAITGRLFVYMSFPSYMTSAWLPAGNFGLNKADALTSVTPLGMMRAGELPGLPSLLTGIHPGSIGESAVILILLGAAYLIYTKTASWRIMISTTGSFLILSGGLFYLGLAPDFPPLQGMLSGSFLFVMVFMATDPVSAPKKPQAQYFYGLLIGTVTALVRIFSLFPEGTSFGILMGNTFASLIDEYAKAPPKKAVKRPVKKAHAGPADKKPEKTQVQGGAK